MIDSFKFLYGIPSVGKDRANTEIFCPHVLVANTGLIVYTIVCVNSVNSTGIDINLRDTLYWSLIII